MIEENKTEFSAQKFFEEEKILEDLRIKKIIYQMSLQNNKAIGFAS